MDITLNKGLRLLEALCTSDKRRGVTELAHELGLQKSNVYRLLQTLAALGYVDQEAEGARYGPTLRIWEYGAMVADRLDLRTVARPSLSKLAEETEETVHLSILSRLEVVYIDKVDSPFPLRAYSRVGGRAPAHCVATGKALLAFADDETLELLARVKLKRFTNTTITSQSKLLKELKAVRQRGYALNRGEWREGVNGLAMPIFDHTRKAVAAVGITLPPVAPSQALLRCLKERSAEISKALGHKLGKICAIA
ncbi:MAG: hypothetical protein A3H27_10800 [Acidobacteria bacterium RIFCSPLOWO2_02_FULL_59_13]|nr:MAG: hypothetical protein A3H27_10800 [Acidobacteria bacterium RIFCSPLOWO2_02_FULL_59_13]OGA60897.1 MAG: hypothetical protein A3G81_23760 [Betaproteobacteria bacterium RIFCSPLOWO2_12_FULL_65_14]